MSVSLGYENRLWEMADKLRGNIESAEYKHIILGLIFLKYISDAFDEKYNELVAEGDGFEEDEDFYIAENIFFVPEKARWKRIKDAAHTPNIGAVIDEAMRELEKCNDDLKGVLPKNYARPEIDNIKLGELIDLFSFNIGNKEARARDTLGRVYEYFLGKFGSSEGEFYTPPSIVKMLVNMIEPFKGRVYDPCCGSGGMFVQSTRFVEEAGGERDDIRVYGQEYTATTWRLCKMNLVIRGVNHDIGTRDADTFANDMHKGKKMDYILANPPFNVKDYYLDPEDSRWQYGIPPKGNANYAWIEHIISKLSDKGTAGFVLANGSMSTSNKQEAEIRRNIIDAGLADCIIAMPTNLFYNVTIPVCLWFLSKNRDNRKDKILFIDGRNLGEMVTRVHREISDEEIQRISGIYHAYRDGKDYEDIPGLCRAASLDEVRKNDYSLVPGRYVGIEDKYNIASDCNTGWKTVKLSELGEIVGGATPSTKCEDYYNGNIAWITPKDLANYNRRFISHGSRNLTEKGFKSCSAKMLPPNSILFTSRAPIGYVAISSNECCTNQGFKSIIPNDSTDYMFLYYLLKYNKSKIEQYGSGTTFQEISANTMKGIEVSVPPLKEQRRIADVLSEIDDVIEKAECANRKLKDTAEAVYNQLFIAGKKSEWKNGKLSDIITVKYGKDHKKLKDGDYPVYGSGGIMRYAEKFIYDKESVLIPRKGSLNNVMYINEPFWSVDTMFYTEMKKPNIAKYVYYFVKGQNLEALNVGSAVPSMTTEILNNMAVTIPDEETLKCFGELVDPIYDMLFENSKHSKKLKELRDTLLPKLMSGEIRL